MYNNRIIPCLLLRDGGLVKTIKFKNPTYVGDPINAVRIFNDKEVDELIFLDITASKENRSPNFDYLNRITQECFMPLCYGGGVSTLEEVKKLFKMGFEKVAINSNAYLNSTLIKEASDIFGSQSIVVSMDVKKDIFGKYGVYIKSGSRNIKKDPVLYAKEMEQLGAGEILLNSIDRDGTMKGYDLALIKKVSEAVEIPVVACGGAGSMEHFADAIKEGGASAVAAGSYFVFYGPKRAVLINYPSPLEIKETLKK